MIALRAQTEVWNQMQSLDTWADRTGTTTGTKRAIITITVPQNQRPW